MFRLFIEKQQDKIKMTKRNPSPDIMFGEGFQGSGG